jgi:hypothetical protein
LQQFVKVVVVLATAVALPGCSDKGGRDYKIDPAQQAAIAGTVKFGKKTLPVGCQVTFFNPDQGIAAVGFLDEAGKFEAKPAEKTTGLPAGKYQVTITPPPPPPMTEAEYQKMEANAMAMSQKVYKELPAKFYNAMSSGLAFDVAPGPNAFDIDLEKK